MSRLGKKPIEIPEGVTVAEKDGVFNFKGAKGELQVKALPLLKIEITEEGIAINPTKADKQAQANWGTMAALVKNAIEGVANGYSKSLILEGVGYRVNQEGKGLVLSVGFSHPVKYEPPEGVAVSADKNNIKVEGIDKHLVGETAAQIRRIKKPEPYKGKGIRYEGEVIRRKAGKKAVGAGE